MSLFYDLTLQRAVLTERSERLQRDGDLARLRRLLRRPSQAGASRTVESNAAGMPSGGLDIVRREPAIEQNLAAIIEPSRRQAA